MKIKELSNLELAQKEAEYRKVLLTLQKDKSRYARFYKVWFMLRKAGNSRGIFEAFIPIKEKVEKHRPCPICGTTMFYKRGTYTDLCFNMHEFK